MSDAEALLRSGSDHKSAKKVTRKAAKEATARKTW
jgi:hypothetical protein